MSATPRFELESEPVIRKEAQTHWISESLWYGGILLSIFIWIYYLVVHQHEIGATAGQPILAGTGFTQGMVTVIAIVIFVTSFFYFAIRRPKERSHLDTIYGVFFGFFLSMTFWGVFAINWDAILGGRIVSALIFICIGLFVLVVSLIDKKFFFKKYSKAGADVPIGIFRWAGAGKIDIVIGVIFLAAIAGLSLYLQRAFIALPTNLFTAASVEQNAFFSGAVGMLENALIIGFVLKTSTSWLTIPFVKFGEKTSIVLATVIGVIIAVFGLYFIAYNFHGAMYFGMEYALATTGGLFAIWGVMTAIRRNTLAADISHVGYNIIVVMSGLYLTAFVLF